MGRRALTLLLTLGALLAPAVLWAAAEGTGRPPLYDLTMKFVNFGILVGLLYYFLRKPITQALAQRRDSIKKELEEALQARDAAEARYQEYKARVADLQAEIRTIHADFQAEGERQRGRLVADAEKAAESIRRQVESAAAHELKRATDELRTEVATLSVQLAEQLLAKAYTAEDQKKAVELTIQNIGRVH
ncbi:MAG: ATP synthase F0 subunit B [Deferrisomatales bacterium]